ncbi:MAG TPA: DNA gyrase modulator, partial [Bacillota bacterium]|nr:DNA gyrase modulator [Bacillota bacterium]
MNRKTQEISVRDGALDSIGEGSDEGYGVRVLVDGAWGFAASNSMTEEDAARTGELAVEYAKAARPYLKRRAEIGECRGEAAYWRAPM